MNAHHSSLSLKQSYVCFLDKYIPFAHSRVCISERFTMVFILSLFILYSNDSQYTIIYTQLYKNLQEFPGLFKVKLWVLMCDQTLTHRSIH